MNIAEPQYSSDRTGLVWGYELAPEAAGRAIGSEEAEAWLAHERPAADPSFLWLHFSLANVAAEKWLRGHLELPEAFFEALGADARSTRVEHVEGALLAVVNDVSFDFRFDPLDVSTLWLSADSRLLVSARRRPLRSIDRLRASVREGAPFHSPVDLLGHLLQAQAEVLLQIVREATVTTDRFEDSLLAQKATPRRSELGALRRVLVRLQRLLAPEPAALFRLLSRPPAWLAEPDLQELRQSAEEFSVVIADMAALVERVKLIQEELAARIVEQDNRSLFVLTAATVIALPINLVAGLLGMNVGGIPFAASAYGFWLVLTFIAILTASLSLFLIHRRRDL